MEWLNYHHLYYFWHVAREGSIARACQELHLAQPTVSSQIRRLERSLGGQLFERAGRGLRLSELGKTVFQYADEIFKIGKELVDVAKRRPTDKPRKLSVGVCDALPKLIVFQLLRPALKLPGPAQLVCREGSLDELLTALAAFELDVVLSDAPIGQGAPVKAFNHLLGECQVAFFGHPSLVRKYRNNFPRSLHGAPLLLPTPHTPLRRALDRWFDEHDIRPVLAGEFQDSALMKVFGQEGLGLFAAPSVIEKAVSRQYAVRLVGRIEDVREAFYAISVERRLKHPAVVALSQAAKEGLFSNSLHDRAPPE